MALLLDTYNILHTTGVLPPEFAGPGIDDLAGLVAASRYARETVQMICDGTGQPRRPVGEDADIRVRFAGPGADADTLIIEMIDAAADPKRVTVVSSDGAIQRAARRRRCAALTSEEFLDHLARDNDSANRTATPTGPAPKPPAPLSSDQVERWIDIFDLDAADFAEPSARPAAPATNAESRPSAPTADPACGSTPGPSSGPSPGPAPGPSHDPAPTDSGDDVDDSPPSLDHGPVFPGDVLDQAERLLDDEPDPRELP